MKVLLVLIVLAIAIYLLVRTLQQLGGDRPIRRRGGLPPRPTRPRGPIGPDDDPEFLRELNRRRKKAQEED